MEEKSDVQAKGTALVAWKQICRPKDQGGFGFLDLSIQIRLSCSRISTNFTTSMMYLGCS
jgi:hypothetical protein